MSKATVTRLFTGSVIAVVAGMILVFAAIWLAYANDAFVMDGPDVVGIRGTAGAWSLVGLVVLAGLTMLAGFVGGVVAWIGALLNTAQLADKTWFLVLLLLGVWNLGLLAMIVYVFAGPDGSSERQRASAITAAPPAR